MEENLNILFTLMIVVAIAFLGVFIGMELRQSFKCERKIYSLTAIELKQCLEGEK